MENDLVNHPTHYRTKNGLETIDVIEAFTDGLNGLEATHTGNVLKYMCRWKKKNGLIDLKKARWYLDRLIEQVEKAELDAAYRKQVEYQDYLYKLGLEALEKEREDRHEN